MRSLVSVSLVMLLALPASAADVVDPPEPSTAYQTTPVTFGIDLAVAALNPSVVVPPGGTTMAVRGTDLAASSPQVRSWIHDFAETSTEPVLLGGAFDPQVRGVSADGRWVLVADELGSPHLVDRGTDAVTQITPPDEETSLVALALSSDGRRAFLQWAAPITSPDERGVGLAIYEDGEVTILDEPTPIAWSPDLRWYLHADRTVVGPEWSDVTDGLGGDPITQAAITNAVDGRVVVVVATDGGAGCQSSPCTTLHRVALWTDGTGGAHLAPAVNAIAATVSDLAVSPDGSRIAFTTTAALTDGPSGTVDNVYVADSRTVRAVSVIELDLDGGVTVEGGRGPVFLDDNRLIFYADVDGASTFGGVLGAAEIPAAGLRIATVDPFGDIFGSTHAGAIWWATDEGITRGCTEAHFCPDAALTRAQAASMLVRALGLEPLSDGPFGDVGGTHAGAINALADAGITAGCADQRFCPDRTLTRAQAASLLARALGLDPVSDGPFIDVTGEHGSAINALAAAGVTAGCTAETYCPNDALTRAQMVTLLYRSIAN